MANQPFPDLTFHPARPLLPSFERLQVIIVGASLAGLAAGIALARKGHKVIIYERRIISTRAERGTVVQFQPNVTKILQQWDLYEDVKRVAHANLAHDVRNYADLTERIASIDLAARSEDEYWAALRGDFLELFRLKALQCGVKIYEGVQVLHLGLGDDRIRRPSVSLSNAQTAEADLVIGADGARSTVREQLFPTYRPERTENVAWSISVPLSVLEKPEFADLREKCSMGHIVVGPSPGKALLAFPIPHKKLLTVQIIDHEASQQQDATAQPGEWVEDLSHLRARFQDADSFVKSVIATADRAFKWRLSEVEGLQKWSTPNGRVILVGDAAHAMSPFSGHDAAMSIEDACALGDLLTGATTDTDIRSLISTYEALRIPRCDRVLKYARSQAEIWTLKEPEQITARNELWRRVGEGWYKSLRQVARAEPMAAFGTPEFMLWMNEYDMSEEVRRVKARSSRL